MYSLYFYIVIKEKNDKATNKLLIFIFLVCAADLLFLTIGTFNGELFRIENHNFIGGPWYSFAAIGPTVCIVSILLYIIINAKKIGLIYSVALSSYLVLSLICAIIQIINREAEISYIGSTLSLLIIYIMLQSNTISENRIRAEIYNDLSSRDFLTGLLNRRGYDLEIKKIKDSENIAVIFCDLNNLKFINDNFGHDSGDKYIQKFSNILKSFFSNDILCRISGDEFVIICVNPVEVFEEKMNEFKYVIENNHQIAAFGYTLGSGNDFIKLVNMAEKLMYDDKKSYYEREDKEIITKEMLL